MLRRGLRPETRKMVCPIDTVALREYRYVDTAGPEADEVPRHKDGRSYGKTMRDLARALAAAKKQRSLLLRPASAHVDHE